MKTNITIGTGQQKQALFNLSQTNNTTATWGHFQPIFSREMKKDDSISIDEVDVIRLAPMPQPTFAKGVKYKKYGMFVPYEDVYKPFANLLSQQPYAPAEGERYIPNKVPFMKVSDLTNLVITTCGYFEGFKKLNQLPSDTNVIQDYDIANVNSKLATLFTEPWLNNITNDQLVKVEDERQFGIGDYDFAWRVKTSLADNQLYYIVCRLSPQGRNIRKILLGLGYQLDLGNNTEVSMLPLFCYYKAYFDIFYPQRNITWTDTKCYTILNIAMQKNIVNMTTMFTEHTDLFLGFSEELANTYYTYNPDYFSSQLGNVSLEKSSQTITAAESSMSYSPTQVSTYTNNLPTATNGNDDTGLNAMQIWLAERMTKFINKNTIVGGKIHEWLAAHGLGRYIDDHRTNFLGSSETNVQVFDVDCTTMQEDSPLGNYAGKGIGSNSNNTTRFTYKADCFGHLIIMGAIVPEIGYFQGTNPMLHHISPLEFYHGEFDSLGMVSTYRANIISNNYNNGAPGRIDNSQPFGLIPRYMEYKCQPLNIINGDMSLGSRMAGLFGYTLDRYLATDGLQVKGTSVVDSDTIGLDHQTAYEVDESLTAVTANLSNSINWRFCNKFPWMGNFDRIFYNANIADFRYSDNSTSYDVSPYAEDNFIIHHYFEVKLSSLMLPISHSYLTEAESESSINVSKE